MNTKIEEEKENFNLIYELSNLLGTGLDKESLSILINLTEMGINPEALSVIVKEIQNESLSQVTSLKK
jgi:mitotic-spindle organizing protein 1